MATFWQVLCQNNETQAIDESLSNGTFSEDLPQQAITPLLIETCAVASCLGLTSSTQLIMWTTLVRERLRQSLSCFRPDTFLV